MSRTKSKNRNEVEYLKGVVKRLKAELKYYKKRAHINEPKKNKPKKKKEPDCPHCGKGFLEEVDLKHVVFKVCNICGHKEKETNNN